MAGIELDEMDRVIAEIARSVKALEARGALPRAGSRFADEGASDDVLQTIARGGSVSELRTIPNHSIGRRRGSGLAFGMKALAEGSGPAGGYLVPEEIAAEVLKLLRARSAVYLLGPTVVPVKKELDITSLTAGATAHFVAENAAIPVSEQTFAQSALLRPKSLNSLVPVSNRLLRDAAGSPDIERVIREDLAEIMALREDLAAIMGTGIDEEPRGIVNSPGLTPGPNLGVNGRTPTFDDLKATVANLRAIDGPFRRAGWLFNSRLLSTLETVKESTGRYLADSDLLEFNPSGTGGRLLGYPFQTTSQIPTGITVGNSSDTTLVIFSSDWQELFVGENQALTIELSGEASYHDGTNWVSAFQSQQTLFRASRTVDYALRRPQLFTVMSGVRP